MKRPAKSAKSPASRQVRMAPSKSRKPPPKAPSPDPESEDGFEDEEDEDYSDGDQDISQFLGDLGDDNDDIEQEKEHGGVHKRAVDSAADSQASKKLKKSGLYKPPTAEELNNLKEVETLFHSNLFGLQLSDMLKEIAPKEKHNHHFDAWLGLFRKTLTTIPSWDRIHDKPETMLKKVTLPLPSGLPRDPKCRFRFVPPKTVQVVGSHAFGGAVGPDAVVDLAVEMPLECFEKTDFLNQRYHMKRALYLAVIASRLRKSELVEEMAFSTHRGDVASPTLILRPSGQAGKHFRVRLLPYPCAEQFKVSRFVPARSNLRASWFFKDNSSGVSDELPSPQYNASVLADMRMVGNARFLAEKLAQAPALVDATRLLKVWLRKRHLDQGPGAFSGFEMTMYLVHLLMKRQLSPMMSSYQAARFVLLTLSRSDLTTEDITLCTEPVANQPSLEEFRANYPLVLVDACGFLNVCASVSTEAYLRVKHEARLAITFLDSCSADSFEVLFVTPLPFERTFDCFVLLNEGDLESAVEAQSLRAELADFSGSKSRPVAKAVCQLLRRGFGSRTDLVSTRIPAPSEWKISEEPPVVRESLEIGLLLDAAHCYATVERGPAADSPDAPAFRQLWGDRSELRRFPDSSILEAVVWSGKAACERRSIVLRIARHLLSRHANIEACTVVGDFLDPLLCPRGVDFSSSHPYGTGEELGEELVSVYDELARSLRRLHDLPLTVSSVRGTSPTLRLTEVFPPLKGALAIDFGTGFVQDKVYTMPLPMKAHVPHLIPISTVVVHMEATGKWPDDLEALRRVKAAFHLTLARLLRDNEHLITAAHPEYVDVFKGGFMFRVRIAAHKEIGLARQTVAPNGAIKVRDTELSTKIEFETEILPGLTSTLHGLQQQHSTFSAACRLAKRWVASHLLSNHVSDECVELLAAAAYVSPAPYVVPNSARLGFQRFLALLANHDWVRQPLILNLADKFTKDQVAELHSTFVNQRSTLPPMFIATPLDGRHPSLWTRHSPTGQIMRRLTALARESLRVLEGQVLCPIEADVKQIFRPPLDPYDVIIHLDEKRVPTSHLAVDCTFKSALRPFKGDVLPVVAFDVVSRYVRALEDAYGQLALFFYDRYGGNLVAVLWKPNAFVPQPLKVSHIGGYMLKGNNMMVPNVEAILEDFSILGKGLVESVETRSTKWTI
ncbi:nucleolar protein 6 isoform X1 [Dermacentor albipictus]|uniref:nucleolar protein 6 isoform X1 n=2 Tax=Dermacentor albipictus TaxID=60249 RepID=UPI0038FC6449